jgi:TATA-box binding protein (TBP) (component of TFIID and TFIIIB)
VNPNGRIKYKDIRKVSIGLSKKDIISYKCKKKGAFYNCFVVIIRKKINNIFKEIHVKVFNTGKLEIPGIKDDKLLEDSLKFLIKLMKQIDNYDIELKYLKEKNETVLINSNFSCGFYLNRNKLYKLLKYKYQINSVFDSCSYPGIQCEFYYNKNDKIQNGQKPNLSNELLKESYMKISFMIFRTGSVLIVGKCTEEMLYIVYAFVKKMLSDEYEEIMEKVKLINNKNIIKRKRKKMIVVNY